jgi:hypothetical protein
MATTTNYSWTTPDDTALVKDGAAAIRSLGTAIDSTVFTNAGNAIAKTIVDAKGDLIVATAADTVARLASSASNGDLLTVDTSTASGLKWAAPAGSGGMTLISTTSLTGASVLLSSIPSTYIHLQLILINFAMNDDELVELRFNDDATASRHKGWDTSSTDNNNNATTYNATKISVSGKCDSVVIQNQAVIDIPNYASTAVRKSVSFFAHSVDPTTTANFRFYNGAGVYNQTTAISSLRILSSGGNFTSGTALLYGVK